MRTRFPRAVRKDVRAGAGTRTRARRIPCCFCDGSEALGVFVADFGQNIAGLCRLRLPRTLAAGQEIRIAHMEMLDEDGTLYMPPLRNAACTDRYIALGDGKDAGPSGSRNSPTTASATRR